MKRVFKATDPGRYVVIVPENRLSTTIMVYHKIELTEDCNEVTAYRLELLNNMHYDSFIQRNNRPRWELYTKGKMVNALNDLRDEVRRGHLIEITDKDELRAWEADKLTTNYGKGSNWRTKDD